MEQADKHVRGVVRIFLTSGPIAELLYHDMKDAEDVERAIWKGASEITDDFGHSFSALPASIAGTMVTDYIVDLEAQLDIAWSRQKAQDRHNERIQKRNELLGRMMVPMMQRPGGPPIVQG